MDVVLCHRTADFDTLGAAVGLAKLNPGTRIVLCGGAHPAVRSFLALYRDEYPLIERRSVNVAKLQSITVVDAQRRELLGKASEWLDLPVPIQIYDHHLAADCDIPTDQIWVEPVGATTTLIVEHLQAQSVSLSVAEATVMALGIHVDTGSLTFDHSTPRDGAALTWLMVQGANVRAIADYIEPGFPQVLQDLLSAALAQLESETVHGYTVSSVLLKTSGYTPGLSSLASQLVFLTESDGLLLGNLYRTRSSGRLRLTVIGRSRIEGTDLNQLFRPLGGGGHARAAAVTLKTEKPTQVLSQLVKGLTAQIPPPPTAADLMSSPVRTIRPDTTIDQARRILLRYGHSGLSVVDESGALVGILSRRDLDLALHHGFGHAPVRGYMTAPVRTIAPETLMPEIESLMVTYDIGRLPVVKDGHLLGIVTRTDILRQIHQLNPQRHGNRREVVRTSIQDRLRSGLPPHLQQLLAVAAAQAEQRGWQLYLVGGAVRDLLLATPAHPALLREFDLVVDGADTPQGEGAGVELARSVLQHYPQAQLQIYGQFQTAALIWHGEAEMRSFSVDFATARSEFYPYPAANPEVAASSIRQDLYRRDFTINALAVRLTRSKSHLPGGELLDFFGGLGDLDARQIRVLHPNSFIEDPTRMFRAVRFATRLGFDLDPQTQAYMEHAIASGIYPQIRGTNGKAPALQSRLRNELKYILQLPQWPQALKRLADLGALSCLHPDLAIPHPWWRQVRLAQVWLQRFDPHGHQHQSWQLILELLLATLPAPDGLQVAQTLHLGESSQQHLAQFASQQTRLEAALSHPQRPSQIVALLSSLDLGELILLAALSSLAVRREIWNYLEHWQRVKPLLNGKDLIQMGYTPGPAFKDLLAQILAATLDREIQTQAQAKQWVRDRATPEQTGLKNFTD
ncbi:CBS domain-containing protein [Synechococcales cyanobacterium C]|uniref:CBS domain-containing protein n=1 Tax=Petrachloros mirabilis ULC683 TaxID=2781853 RepID=A0A8K2AGU8_9CYAN|nr:CBS domain-containing protein [Petrachloros mirabilis]NCJ05434.1 CBS domain-containing protein [Petrachloros mirabilis ULC683]